MRQTTKEIEVGGQRYQLAKMTPQRASRIHSLLVSVAVKMTREFKRPSALTSEDEQKFEEASGEAKANGAVELLWSVAAEHLSEEAYAGIQQMCLLSCRGYLGGELAGTVVMADGRWASPELADDAVAVDRLVREALQFNIAPFFFAGEKPASSPESASSQLVQSTLTRS